MTKSEIVNDLTEKSSLGRKEVLAIVDGFLDRVKKSIHRGEQVEIRGFGTFYRADKKARKVNSPIAGRVLDIPAKSTLGFRASKIAEREMNIKGV